MVIDTIREAEEDKRRVKMANLVKQGAHTRWEVPEKILSYGDIISTSETSLKLLVKAVYDLLPTLSNEKNIVWGQGGLQVVRRKWNSVTHSILM